MVRHFSHGHSLRPFEVEKEEGLCCSCCELELSGSAYRCNARSNPSSPLDCNSFYLHKSCLKLQREIQHPSHPQHPLTLFPVPPGSSLGMFTCAACDRYGFGFTYNCEACDINLHVRCAKLPETLTRPDLHQHSLSLVFQVKEDEIEDNKEDDEDEDEDEEDRDVACGVCLLSYFKEECWAYRCNDCRCVVHLECAIANDDVGEAAKDQEEEEEEVEEEEEEEEEEKDEEVEDEEKEEEENEEAEEKEDEEAEEKEDEEAEDDGEETEEDSDSIIARNIEKNAVLQMMLYNQNARRMRMQQQKMMNSIRTPFFPC